jgi:DNA-nicking Smr family endonuclease
MDGNLDLHGVKHEDVKQILDKRIWECMKSKKKRLWVITGHSDEMKRIVRDVSRDYGITAVESMFNSAELILDF